MLRTLSDSTAALRGARAGAGPLSVALEDQTCPPSTIFAAFNAWDHEDKKIGALTTSTTTRAAAPTRRRPSWPGCPRTSDAAVER